tara:strand:+ start:1364 stop:1624 length:261 start_codon:yes stop_codon:yes gene_type:complete
MKIKIIGDRQPFVDGRKAMEGEEFDVSDAAGKDMISSGLAIRADDTPKRARNSKGQLQKDDPATEANEAWVGGVAPKKKAKKKNAK